MEKSEVSFSIVKKIIFYSIAFILPFLIILIIETILRFSGCGNDYPLVKQTTFFRQKVNVVNREITKRYFTADYKNLPTPDSGPFQIKKSKNTYRIICLGGSTTAGYPYIRNATFPFQLKVRLQKVLTDKHIEVINLGIAAVNSYTVLDLLSEAIEQQPDLLVIYMGHNEFYGAFGVGSTLYAGMNRSLILLYLKLSRFRIVQILQKAFQTIRGKRGKVSGDSSATLMETMVRDPSPRHSPQYLAIASANFEKNLEEILNTANKAQVPVLLCTLVSNLRDHEPFVSTYSESTDFQEQERWEELFQIARNHQANDQHDQALAVFNQLEKMDPNPARLFFFRGRSHEKLGNIQSAYNDYIKARDLDQLKFRAPGIFNDIIKDLALMKDVLVVDMETVFRAASPNSIPGNNLFHEHLHPNFSGQKLMAETLLKPVLAHMEVGSMQKEQISESLLSKQQIEEIVLHYEAESGNITLLDLEFGNFRNFLLTNRWPFPEKKVTINNYQPLGNRATKDLAYNYCTGRISWELAHYRLAEHYKDQGKTAMARAEYMAVYETFPKIPALTIKILDLFTEENKVKEALEFCTKAIETSPENPLLLVRKSLILMQMKQFNKSISQLNEALQVEQQNKKMSTEQKSYLYYLMSMSYSNLKQLDNAITNIDTALKFDPEFEPAKDFKETLIRRKMSRNSERKKAR